METPNFFKLKNILDLNTVDKNTKIPTSDFCQITSDNKLVQFELVEIEENNSVEVVPGLFKIVKSPSGLKLDKTKFSHDNMLSDYANNEHIEKIIDCFFKNLHMYKEFGIEVPKRNMLLYGPPGAGKTSSLQKTATKYLEDGKTSVITWDTYAFEAYDVKEFISQFKYNGVEKLIVIAEDIGGISNEGSRVKSSSSLLRLLDNTDKTFTIPVMIIATTNFIAGLEENLANRSGRFDDKFEVGFPSSKNRVDLLKFFAKEYATDGALEFIQKDSCKKFSVAHIKECYIRSRLHDKNLEDVLREVAREIEEYHKGFSKQQSMGLGF